MITGQIVTTVILNGPSGILVPLGFENFMDVNTARMFYNYVATIFLLAIAATCGSRSEPAYCFLIPVFAGVFTMFGWFSFSDPARAVTMMVIAGMFGIMIYMNETNHEKNGVAGPGSKLLNIVFFLIFFQVILGVMPTFGVFDPSTTAGVAFNQSYCPPSANCGSYSNVALSQSLETSSNQNGWLHDASTLIYAATMAFIGMIIFMVSVIINVLLSASVIATIVNGLWPGVGTSIPFLAFMGILSVIFWACDVIFISNAYLKLFPSEASL